MTSEQDRMAQLGEALRNAPGSKPAIRQRTIARALGHAQIEVLKKDPRYCKEITLSPGPGKPEETLPLYAWLERLLDVTWPEKDDHAQQNYIELGRALRENITDEISRHASIRFIARLGHLYQLAGLQARDNLLQQLSGSSTAESFLNGNLGSKSGRRYNMAADAVAALNKPQFELTFTAHPTSTSSIPSMQEQRELGMALAHWGKDASQKPRAEAALKAFGTTAILPMQGDQPRNMHVREEADYMLYYLANSYEDIANVYASYDKALSQLHDYHPETLKLGVKFHSWGSSGDKDGNKKVNADTTLYAIAAHYDEMLTRYEQALARLPGLDTWKQRITQARQECQRYRAQLNDRDRPIPEAQFDLITANLKKVVAPLDAKAFEADLEKSYKETKNTEALNLMRRVHTFGFTFGAIEYRETAEEFERIVAALVPGYAEKGELERERLLNGLLQDPKQCAALLQAFKDLGKGGEGKPYSDTDVAPIAYHTRKRLELARAFPGMIKNQVLAECKSTSNMLEALLLQHAAGEGKKRPLLGIVPLFEDGERLKAAPVIVKAALYSPPYREHMEAVAAAQESPPAQQVQLAHSDNARRNGMPAARGLIAKAHDELRQVMSQYNAANDQAVAIQFYEGGSQSDPYRGGARSISATVNEFGIHDFTKMTYQGGDLLNYLNQPMSSFRLLTRNLTYSAAKLDQPSAMRPKTNPQERLIINALDSAKSDYVQLFEGPEINDFMRAIGYLEEAPAGANGSRATQRKANDDTVDVTAIRTISYSEVLQHAGLAPTWLGTLNLRDALGKQMASSKSPQGLHTLYENSPVFKDVLDRVLFGLVRSDMDYLDRASNHHPLMSKFREEYAAAFALAYEGHTGKKAPKLSDPAAMRQVLIDEFYPHMKDVLEDQDRFLNLARGIKRHWLPDTSSNHALQRQLLHNALDTVYHGRLPLVDDPTYARLYRDAIGVHIGHDREHGVQVR